MGAACASADGRDRAAEATDADAECTVDAEEHDSLDPPGKPLWLLEHEERLEEERAAESRKAAVAVKEPVPPQAPARSPAPAAPEVSREAKRQEKAVFPDPAERDLLCGGAPKVPPLEIPEAQAPAARPKLSDLRYVLRVTVVSARGLRDADWLPGTGLSDPYCICRLRRDPLKKFQTHTINDELNPTWDHTSEISGFSGSDVLEFSIYDKDPAGDADDLLGEITINQDQILPNGFDGELRLRKTSTTAVAVEAYLRLRVVVVSSFVQTEKGARGSKEELDAKKVEDGKGKKPSAKAGASRRTRVGAGDVGEAAAAGKAAGGAGGAEEAAAERAEPQAEEGAAAKKPDQRAKKKKAKKVEPEAEAGEDARAAAAESFRRKSVKEQGEFGAELRKAAAAGNTTEVARLLESGVDPNIEDGDGWTALMKAAEAGDPGATDALLKAGANVKAAVKLGEWGNTALHLAARHGHRAVAELLAAKSDLRAKNYKGKTAAEVAKEEGHKELARWLRGVEKG